VNPGRTVDVLPRRLRGEARTAGRGVERVATVRPMNQAAPSDRCTGFIIGLVGLMLALPATAPAATPPGKPAAAQPAPRAAKPAARRPAAPAVQEASAEQMRAAELVYYGRYECEDRQSIRIDQHAGRAGYVDVRHGKALYVMKPVLSSTGAIRLEDVKGRTLMVQIATKSMLMDVKAGRRLVDECVSPKQREAIDAAKAAALAASAASAPASAVEGAASGVAPSAAEGAASGAAGSPQGAASGAAGSPAEGAASAATSASAVPAPAASASAATR